MARPFKSLVPVFLLLLATLLATTAALDTQHATGPKADTLRSLPQGAEDDQSARFGGELSGIFSIKSIAPPVANSDAFVAAANGAVLGALSKNRKLSSVFVALSAVYTHGRLLPARNPGKRDSAVTELSDVVVGASSASEAMGALQKGRKLSSVAGSSNAVHVQGRLLPARNPGHHTDSAGIHRGGGRKLVTLSGAVSVVPGHGRLLPKFRY